MKSVAVSRLSRAIERLAFDRTDLHVPEDRITGVLLHALTVAVRKDFRAPSSSSSTMWV